MSILSDNEIIELAKQGMIYPFESGQVKQYGEERLLSYGTSSYGYDMRCGSEFLLFINSGNVVIDPKNFDRSNFKLIKSELDISGSYKPFYLPPHGFALSHSKEYFKIPENVSTVVVGKSTYARCGLFLNITPLEAGWEGVVTIEFFNSTPCPLMIYPDEGIAQLLFFRGKRCRTSYRERNGKYQGQTNITDPIV